MSIEGVERDLHLTRDELSDLKKSYNDLEAEKQRLIYEIRDCKEIKRKQGLCKMNKTNLFLSFSNNRGGIAAQLLFSLTFISL